MAAEDREQAIEEIVASARGARPRTPRWLWILAGVIGAACAIAFCVAIVAGGDAPSTGSSGAPMPAASTGAGFGAGIAVGIALGVAIGFAIARQTQAVRAHSSRKSP